VLHVELVIALGPLAKKVLLNSVMSWSDLISCLIDNYQIPARTYDTKEGGGNFLGVPPSIFNGEGYTLAKFFWAQRATSSNYPFEHSPNENLSFRLGNSS
jgi:hypothetical protein